MAPGCANSWSQPPGHEPIPTLTLSRRLAGTINTDGAPGSKTNDGLSSPFWGVLLGARFKAARPSTRRTSA